MNLEDPHSRVVGRAPRRSEEGCRPACRWTLTLSIMSCKPKGGKRNSYNGRPGREKIDKRKVKTVKTVKIDEKTVKTVKIDKRTVKTQNK